MSEFKLFDIIHTEWREQYGREEGLGIITSVPNDGSVWICKIEKDNDGYFIIPNAVYRGVSKIRPSTLKVSDISITFE